MMPDIGVVINSAASGQRSMIGYGELVLEAARQTGASVAEFEGASRLSRLLPGRFQGARLGKAVRDVERFVLSPVALGGRGAGIVHVVDPGNAIYLGVIRHRASVVTVHDMIPYLCLAGRLEGFRPSRYGRMLMRRIMARLKRADRIVCVSEATRRDLLEIEDIEPARVTVIANAVFQPMAPASPQDCAALRAELGIPPDACVLLNIGRNFYKNRSCVLDVFSAVHRAMPSAFLVFVSPQDAGLAATIAKRHLQDHVRFVPFLPASKLAALYTTADLLLFPSLYEGFGYPVLEAQMCGTPVICSNAGSLPEVAGSGAHLFAPHDVDAMAQAAIALLSDPAAAGATIRLGHENARRFDRRDWFAAHARLYAELGVSAPIPVRPHAPREEARSQ